MYRRATTQFPSGTIPRVKSRSQTPAPPHIIEPPSLSLVFSSLFFSRLSLGYHLLNLVAFSTILRCICPYVFTLVFRRTRSFGPCSIAFLKISSVPLLVFMSPFPPSNKSPCTRYPFTPPGEISYYPKMVEPILAASRDPCAPPYNSSVSLLASLSRLV